MARRYMEPEPVRKTEPRTMGDLSREEIEEAFRESGTYPEWTLDDVRSLIAAGVGEFVELGQFPRAFLDLFVPDTEELSPYGMEARRGTGEVRPYGPSIVDGPVRAGAEKLGGIAGSITDNLRNVVAGSPEGYDDATLAWMLAELGIGGATAIDNLATKGLAKLRRVPKPRSYQGPSAVPDDYYRRPDMKADLDEGLGPVKAEDVIGAREVPSQSPGPPRAGSAYSSEEMADIMATAERQGVDVEDVLRVRGYDDDTLFEALELTENEVHYNQIREELVRRGKMDPLAPGGYEEGYTTTERTGRSYEEALAEEARTADEIDDILSRREGSKFLADDLGIPEEEAQALLDKWDGSVAWAKDEWFKKNPHMEGKTPGDIRAEGLRNEIGNPDPFPGGEFGLDADVNLASYTDDELLDMANAGMDDDTFDAIVTELERRGTVSPGTRDYTASYPYGARPPVDGPGDILGDLEYSMSQDWDIGDFDDDTLMEMLAATDDPQLKFKIMEKLDRRGMFKGDPVSVADRGDIGRMKGEIDRNLVTDPTPDAGPWVAEKTRAGRRAVSDRYRGYEFKEAQLTPEEEALLDQYEQYMAEVHGRRPTYHGEPEFDVSGDWTDEQKLAEHYRLKSERTGKSVEELKAIDAHRNSPEFAEEALRRMEAEEITGGPSDLQLQAMELEGLLQEMGYSADEAAQIVSDMPNDEVAAAYLDAGLGGPPARQRKIDSLIEEWTRDMGSEEMAREALESLTDNELELALRESAHDRASDSAMIDEVLAEGVGGEDVVGGGEFRPETQGEIEGAVMDSLGEGFARDMDPSNRARELTSGEQIAKTLDALPKEVQDAFYAGDISEEELYALFDFFFPDI
jgi:hypothetical protein